MNSEFFVSSQPNLLNAPLLVDPASAVTTNILIPTWCHLQIMSSMISATGFESTDEGVKW